MCVVMNCHIICILYHLQIKLINNFLLFIVFVKKYGGMTIAVKVEFLRYVSFFLYRLWVLNTEEDFQEMFSIFYTKNCVYQQAKDFIDEKLGLEKEKSIAFYMKHILTAGHASSQRSESLNGLIKGFGSLKQKIVQWNLYQLMT